jgi:hypothetical protein
LFNIYSLSSAIYFGRPGEKKEKERERARATHSKISQQLAIVMRPPSYHCCFPLSSLPPCI